MASGSGTEASTKQCKEREEKKDGKRKKEGRGAERESEEEMKREEDGDEENGADERRGMKKGVRRVCGRTAWFCWWKTRAGSSLENSVSGRFEQTLGLWALMATPSASCDPQALGESTLEQRSVGVKDSCEARFKSLGHPHEA